ncbi:ribokinase [Candidatus Microgenomates bacterium]|nr:ribokinase [Candidatus Microgenomates bacterium]
MLNNKVSVVGGLTMDLSYYLNKWPKVGQAVQATDYKLEPGGKGLNLATGLSRLGLEVIIIASLGNDDFSRKIIKVLNEEKINSQNVFQFSDTRTDLIGIIVGPDGQPGFIGVTNASGKLSVENIQSKRDAVKSGSVLGVNQEVSSITAKASLKLAKEENVITVFNPAPPDNFDFSVLPFVDYLVLNDWEAKYILQKPNDSLENLAQEFFEKGAKNVCITLGENGSLFFNSQGVVKLGIYQIEEKDATGAGDSFSAGLIYGLVNNFEKGKLFNFASACGALACTKLGSRSSMPTLKEIEDFMKTSVMK